MPEEITQAGAERSQPTVARGWSARVVLSALLVAGGVVALALPAVLVRWTLTPDAIEYMGIANNLVSGAGFVDPVVYTSYLAPHYPMPAAAVRPPLFPLLLALPLGLGASITTIQVLQVFWAALVAAGMFLLARRWASLPAALAASIGFSWAFGFIVMARIPLTEVTGVALVLGLVACVSWSGRSARGGAVFGCLAFAAWMCHPNLAVALPAFLAAIATRDGPRAALRSRPAWAAVATFGLIAGSTSVALLLMTGFRPYAHLGFLLQSVGAQQARLYQRKFIGAPTWLWTHASTLLHGVLAWNAREIFRSLFLRPDYHFVGWLAVPGFVRALRGVGRGADERRFMAWFILGLIPSAFFVPGSVDPMRLSIFFAICGWLLAAEFLDVAATRLATAVGDGRWRAAWQVAPLALIVAAFVLSPSARFQIRVAEHGWRAYRAKGTRAIHKGWPEAASLCHALEPNAIVSSPDPWAVYLWCGNLGLWVPVDLDTPAWVDRYLDQQAPAYVVVGSGKAFAALRHSPRLEETARVGTMHVLRVVDAPARSRPWIAPPALVRRSAIRPEAAP